MQISCFIYLDASASRSATECHSCPRKAMQGLKVAGRNPPHKHTWPHAACSVVSKRVLEYDHEDSDDVAGHKRPTTNGTLLSLQSTMSKRESRLSINRQHDALSEFENCAYIDNHSARCYSDSHLLATVKKKFLLANKHITKCVYLLISLALSCLISCGQT